MLTKEQILNADDLPRKLVQVPEWGGDVWVKTMTGAERDAWEASLMEDREVNAENIRARLCVRSIVDEAGRRVFADEDADKLGGKSARALDRIFSVAQRLNGVSAQDLDEIAKNSERARAADSLSD